MQNKLECEIKFGYDQMDFHKITIMLSQAYWSKNIKIEEVKKGAENSALNVGIFLKNDQIGYARVISDKTRFAYLLDVIVDESFRHKGLGQFMINSILKHNDLIDVYQWLLITKDAHGVYQKSGFTPLNLPDWYMEIRGNRPER